jgi:hypothetical protein
MAPAFRALWKIEGRPWEPPVILPARYIKRYAISKTARSVL